MNFKKTFEKITIKMYEFRFAVWCTLACGVPVKSVYAEGLQNPILSEAIDMLSTAIMWGGIALMVWGLIDIGRTFSENGAQGDASRGFWKLLGGAVIFASKILLSYIK